MRTLSSTLVGKTVILTGGAATVQADTEDTKSKWLAEWTADAGLQRQWPDREVYLAYREAQAKRGAK